MERLSRELPDHPLAMSHDAPDEFLELLARTGGDVEAQVLRAIRSSIGSDLVDLSGIRGSVEERVAATVAGRGR